MNAKAKKTFEDCRASLEETINEGVVLMDDAEEAQYRRQVYGAVKRLMDEWLEEIPQILKRSENR